MLKSGYKGVVALFLLALLVLSSCASQKQVGYFQDLKEAENVLDVGSPLNIKIAAGDKLSIMLNTKDPMVAELFNLPFVAREVGNRGIGFSTPIGMGAYTVDKDGNIAYPVLGLIHVAGKTRQEISEYIQDQLREQELVNDVVVIVEYLNLTFDVLGEVNHPGRYKIDKDKITLLDAISLAGDLTIDGRRIDVLVLREEEETQKVYKVNLCSADQLFSSPAYYLKQNDIVYVAPSKKRMRQSTVNGNTVLSASFWISLVSLLTSVVLLFK